MLKHYSGKEIVKRLTRLGFNTTSQKGSHLKMRGRIDGKLKTVIIPMHKQVAQGTLNSILRQAGITKQILDAAK